MITVISRGRLGNLLFQYAFARFLSDVHDSTIVLDLYNQMSRNDVWASNTIRDLKLLNLDVSFRRPLLSRFARRTLDSDSYIRSKYGPDVFREARSDFGFQPAFMNIPDGACIDGYFQSEKYFESISDRIREDFNLSRVLLNYDAGDIQSRIRDENSVAVHYRRGDYLDSKLHNVCTEAYYRTALEIMRDVHGDGIRVFVFSDDIEWCEKNVNVPSCIFVRTPVAAPPIYDIALMSLCKHQVIANSTFSWWGAWMNEYQSKTVLAPNRWFTDPEMNKRAMEHVLPKRWTRVDF